MVAILTRIFGIEHLNLAEDVVQEALARALQTWPFYGVPENPSSLDYARVAQSRAGRGPATKSISEQTGRNHSSDGSRRRPRRTKRFSQKTKLATTDCD